MRFYSASLSALLFSTATFAAPSGQRRHSKPLSTRQDSLNGNWAGAVINSPPSGLFTSASGQYVLPQASLPGGAQPGQQYGVAFWVGIGSSTILQSGVDSIVNEDGTPGFSAWYEFYPEPSGDLTDGLDLAAGDTIEVCIDTPATQDGNGTVTINNLSKGTSRSQSLAPPTGQTVDYNTAEWIAEDYSVSNGEINFPNFGNVVFTNCQASTTEGGPYDLSTATLDDIDQNNVQLTQSSIDSTSQVTINYTGP